MTTPITEERKTVRNVPVTEKAVEDAFDAGTKLRAIQRRNVPSTELFDSWLEAGHVIYCATTREEALASASALFDSNPDHQRMEG